MLGLRWKLWNLCKFCLSSGTFSRETVYIHDKQICFYQHYNILGPLVRDSSVHGSRNKNVLFLWKIPLLESWTSNNRTEYILISKRESTCTTQIVKSMVPGSGDLVLRVRGSIPYTMMLTFFIIVKENEIKYILKITYFNVIFQK